MKRRYVDFPQNALQISINSLNFLCFRLCDTIKTHKKILKYSCLLCLLCKTRQHISRVVLVLRRGWSWIYSLLSVTPNDISRSVKVNHQNYFLIDSWQGSINKLDCRLIKCWAFLSWEIFSFQFDILFLEVELLARVLLQYINSTIHSTWRKHVLVLNEEFFFLSSSTYQSKGSADWRTHCSGESA